MSIIRCEYLKEKISGYNLIPLEVSHLKISNQIHLSINNIEDFLRFASDSLYDYVYFYYTYYDSEYYKIPFDWYSDYPRDFITKISKHNRSIESLDFSTPKSLTLFILQNGMYVGIVFENRWIENDEIEDAEEAIEMLENTFYDELKEIKNSKEDLKKDDENELREIIINDPEFRYCKNQELRYWYLVEMLEKEDMKKYEYLVQPPGIPHNGKIKMFMDKTWILYKERKK
ncbi:hypothetical protein [Saliterribacillus persicus]|uniref:Uncharacterized protein n=1 Tax=Saliterribacillus persicus TaxID=930114 RepID=A0A368Y6K6_9BACI|nr:hypothetical protein [Saliterribacillus persicus]RCW74988.1 hypothetical protein DFR57_103285 [Saliterribacillus persicus]